MNKFLRVIIYISAFVLLFIGGFCTLIQVRGIPKYDAPAIPTVKVDVTPENVALGAKIANVQCNFCHKNNADGKLSGKLMSDLPPDFGEVHSANITQSKEHGIGSWTDGELMYFLRTGVRKNGQYAPIYMPKYTHMSDDDMKSIIAFLRSDQPLVQASEIPTVKPIPSFLVKFLCLVAFKPMPYPTAPIVQPDTTKVLEYGKYLTLGRYECWSCHSADFKTLDFKNPEATPGFCQGGNTMFNLEGHKIYTANISPDDKTGIGPWTQDDFTSVMRELKRKDGKALRYPMLSYNALSEGEIKAIWQYLRGITPRTNEVDRQWDKDI